jgi:hypothetical protein
VVAEPFVEVVDVFVDGTQHDETCLLQLGEGIPNGASRSSCRSSDARLSCGGPGRNVQTRGARGVYAWVTQPLSRVTSAGTSLAIGVTLSIVTPDAL